MAKKKFRRSFRKNTRINHPAYIIDQDGNMYAYIGITHSETIKKEKINKGKAYNEKNVLLDKNPDPRDTRKAYVRPVVESDHIKNFGRRYDDWSFAKSDKRKVNRIIGKYKKGKN